MKTLSSHATIVSVAAAAALLLALPACGKKSLDKSVNKLVKAARANNYKAFKEMSHPDLVAKFSAEKFKLLSESLNLLGAFKDRSMRGIKARSGKVREGRYKLTFEKGVVDLKITLTRGKITAFFFTGEDMEKAMKKVSAKAFSVFKVGSFHFLDGDSKRNVFRSGQKVRFKVAIYGMKPTGGNLKIQAGIKVVNASGKVVLQNPKFVDSAVPLKSDDAPVGTVSGSITIPVAGHYKLQLRITDGHSGKSLDYTTALLVEK
jgi:hypothetical protein